MYCNNCGKNIPDGSQFCENCGFDVSCDETPETEQDSVRITEQTVELEERTKKTGWGWIIAVFGLMCFLFFVFILGNSDDDGNSVSTASEVPAVASSTEPRETSLSPVDRQIRIKIERQLAHSVFENFVNDYLKNPDTAKYTHDKSSWKGQNAILTGSGTVTHKNSKSETLSEPFTVSILMSERISYPLYIKLGDSVLIDQSKGTNSLGIATKYGPSIFNVKQSESIIKPEDGKLIVVSDDDSIKITLDEFNRIKSGMGYDEVSEIVGSLGGRSDSDANQNFKVTWDGLGESKSNAIVTFQNGKVTEKTQSGLK